MMTSPNKFQVNLTSDLSTYEQKMLDEIEAGNGSNPAANGEKLLIRTGVSHHDFTNHVWDHSDLQFLWKCVETSKLRRADER